MIRTVTREAVLGAVGALDAKRAVVALAGKNQVDEHELVHLLLPLLSTDLIEAAMLSDTKESTS